MGTAKNAVGSIGKDEVPGPNPGSSSKIAGFQMETSDFLFYSLLFIDRQKR